MADETGISWADMTHNEWIGCTKVTPACDGCYAEQLMQNRHKRVVWGGERVLTKEQNRNKPLKWNREALAAGTRPFVFCSSLSDVFDNQVPAEWRARLFATIRKTPALVWLLLTKRPQNIIKLSEAAGGLPANAALGTTIEDQIRADQNVPHLYAASIRLAPLFTFVSIEPILGEVNLRSIAVTPGRFDFLPRGHDRFDALQGLGRIGWVITGGETDQGDHKARPWHPNWVRRLLDDCAATGTPFHHKQHGEWVPHGFDGQERGSSVRWLALINGEWREYAGGPVGDTVARVGKKRSGRLLDGVEHNARPYVRPIASAA